MPVLEVALFLSCCLELVQMKEERDDSRWNWLMLLGWIISMQLPRRDSTVVPGWTCRQLFWWGPVNSIVPPS